MRFRRRSKYGAVKVKADGYTFDSRSEYRRYCQLRLLERAGKIEGLRVHERLPLMVGEKCIGHYEADFSYEDTVGGILVGWVYEDVKGVRTEVYRLKKKILEANGIKIREINAKDVK